MKNTKTEYNYTVAIEAAAASLRDYYRNHGEDGIDLVDAIEGEADDILQHGMGIDYETIARDCSGGADGHANELAGQQDLDAGNMARIRLAFDIEAAFKNRN